MKILGSSLLVCASLSAQLADRARSPTRLQSDGRPMRNQDGSVAAATLLSDINYRSGGCNFLGAFLHEGDTASDVPILIKEPAADEPRGGDSSTGRSTPRLELFFVALKL